MEVSQINKDTIGRFVAVPRALNAEVKTIDDVLKHYSRGFIPFYVFTRRNKFDASVKETCNIYEVLENGSLRLNSDNFN